MNAKTSIKQIGRFVHGESWACGDRQRLIKPNRILFYKVSWLEVMPSWYGRTAVIRYYHSKNFATERSALAFARSTQRKGLYPRIDVFYPEGETVKYDFHF
jgi:hypothetical protein